MKTGKKIIMVCAGFTLILLSGMVMAQDSLPQKLSRAVIKIDTLSCGGCFSTINAGLAPMEGYSGMGANLFRKLIAIDFRAPLTPEKISKKLSDVGYPGKLDSVEEISEKESFAYIESKRTGFGSSGGGCCSAGGPPSSQGRANKGSSGLLPQAGGSCCTSPGNSTPTENL